jgi:hypothetical protein
MLYGRRCFSDPQLNGAKLLRRWWTFGWSKLLEIARDTVTTAGV